VQVAFLELESGHERIVVGDVPSGMAQHLDDIVVEALRLEDKVKPADLSEWEAVVDASEHPVDEVTVAVVGKYVDHQDAYKSLSEALRHGGIRQRTRVRLKWMESEQVERAAGAGVDGILVPGLQRSRLRRRC
jgi:CTP synthase